MAMKEEIGATEISNPRGLPLSRGFVVDAADNVTEDEFDRFAVPLAADEVLRGPRKRLGPPWQKDHRVAVAATVVGGSGA